MTMSSIKFLNAWSVEMRAPWERNGECVYLWGFFFLEVRVRILKRKKKKKTRDVPPSIDVGSDSPAAREGGRKARDVCPPPSHSSSSPLHSVLSSRCQEVAQCFFLFFFLNGCMIFLIFSQTGSQKVSGRFVCVLIFSVPVPH